MSKQLVPLLPGAQSLAGNYKAWFCDVWGVVHNGVEVFTKATDALSQFRASGGRVILVTNAPRPAGNIEAQLDQLNVPRQAYDMVVTSGDVTRDMLSSVGNEPVIHIGPDRDKPLLEGMDFNLVAADKADHIICTGLRDDTTETPDDYTEELMACATRGAIMICANPDIVVERGTSLFYCAGALAAEYKKLGGKVVYGGKPHGAVYDLCFRSLAEITGETTEKSEVLAIGDGLKTDILGAHDAGLDALYVADGIHREDIVDAAGVPDQDLLDGLFKNVKRPPVAAVFGLSW